MANQAYARASGSKKLRLKCPQYAGMSQYALCCLESVRARRNTTAASIYNALNLLYSSCIFMRGKEKYEFRERLLQKHLSPPHVLDNAPALSPALLAAISDQSQPRPLPSFIERIALFYKYSMGTIRPDSFFLLMWNVFIVLIVLFYILEMGFLLAFGEQFWRDELSILKGFHILFTLMLVADVFVAPLKAYYEDGFLIIDVYTILRRYLSLQGPIDALAILSIIIPLASGSLQSNWVKVVWILKFYTVERINKQFQRVTQLYISWNTVYLVIKLTVVGVLYAHYMGIGFYLVSLWVYENNYYGPNTPNLCWIYNSWAFYQMALYLSWYQTYIYIMYFSIAVVTTIAYGDITPKNPIQCIYIIVILIMVTLILGYIMTEILRLLISVFSYNYQRKYAHYQLVQKLKNQQVQQETQAQIRAHTEEIDREEQFRNRQVEEQVLSFLPAEPLYALLIVIYSDFLKEMGLDLGVNMGEQPLEKMQLKHNRSLFLEKFMKDIKEHRHYVGDLIYKEGEASSNRPGGHCAYYFTKRIYVGAVTLGVGQIPKLKAGKIDDTLKHNCFQLAKTERMFGAVQMLNGQRRTHWAICLSNCIMFEAERDSIFKNYALLTQEEKEALQLRMEQVGQACLICHKDHPSLRCYFTFLTPDSFVNQDIKAHRKRRILQASRTRLKTLSSWTLFTRIRHQRVRMTKEYKDKLLFDRASHALFVEYELQDDNPFEQEEAFETRLFEAEVIAQQVYNEAAQELNACALEFQYDQVRNYKIYRPHNNIEEVRKDFNSRERRIADFKNVVNANLLRLFH